MKKSKQQWDNTGAPYLGTQNDYRRVNPASRPQSGYDNRRPVQNRPNGQRPSGQSPNGQRAGGYYPPRQQTVHPTARPYGDTRPVQPPRNPDARERLLRAREAQAVRMQVQCCVPVKRKRRNHRWLIALLAVLVLVGGMVGIALGVAAHRRGEEAKTLANGVQDSVREAQGAFIGPPATPPVTTSPPETEPPGPAAVMAVSNAATATVGEEIKCTNAIVIDVADGTALAERLPDQRIYPASMTKVMTLIVAYEEIESFDQTFTFTADLINPLVAENASRAGFMAGETVSVIDLFYGAALPSGADATTALAILVAGSEEAFAERMNEKAAEMGLTGTHFTNASGLHDDRHYSTVREIAAIFAYAMQIEPLREIMSAYQYTTTATTQNPEGLLLTSTLFSSLSGDELPGMKIIAGKTGYTLEAKRCLVSMAIRDDGREYIAVVVGGEGKWTPITDSVELYAMCLPAEA